MGSMLVVVARVSLIATFTRSRKTQAIVACMAIGIALAETAARSLSQESERPPPSMSDDGVQVSAVKMALLNPQQSSLENVTTSSAQPENWCKSFESWFLNPSCSRKTKKHAAQPKHRVATFIRGRSNASPSSTSDHILLAREAEGLSPQAKPTWKAPKRRERILRSASLAITPKLRSAVDQRTTPSRDPPRTSIREQAP
jgi:hypothetical protein